MKHSRILLILILCTQVASVPTEKELISEINRIEIDWLATKAKISDKNDRIKKKFGNSVQYWEKAEFVEEPGVTGIGLIFYFGQKYHCVKEYTFYRDRLYALKIDCGGEYKYRETIKKILSKVKYEIKEGISVEKQEESHFTAKVRYIDYAIIITSDQVRAQMLDDADYRVKRAIELQAERPRPNKNGP